MPSSAATDITVATIAAFTAANGYPPSIRELQLALGHASPSSTYRVLCRLRDRGVIEWTTGRTRTIQVKS